MEIITGEVPYARLHDMAVLNAINSKQHPKRPDEHIPKTSVSGEALWSLLSRCWAFEPKSRPPVEWVQDVMEMINPEGLVQGGEEEDLGISKPVIDE
ncbi:hypothetical protein FRC12_005485 [Ceratobasidium sp. 428]|nr:hypothetical protein FRC12_005485 [Ceratobasidium sp. 428]